MHVISRKKLRGFWKIHPRARPPLEAWYQKAKSAEWDDFADVMAMFPHADRYDRFVIFDIGGNKYRLIAVIHYNRHKVFIRHVLTHAAYSTGDWKDQ